MSRSEALCDPFRPYPSGAALGRSQGLPGPPEGVLRAWNHLYIPVKMTEMSEAERLVAAASLPPSGAPLAESRRGPQGGKREPGGGGRPLIHRPQVRDAPDRLQILGK